MQRPGALCRTATSLAAALFGLTVGILSTSVTAGANGSITVEVIVDGEDRSGGSFSVVVLPADYPQPVVTEEVEKFRYKTERGRVRVEGVEPGRYLVAIVLANSLMKEKPSASVEVVAPDWVRNSSGVTSGFWPAFEVEVSAGKPDASVKFVRVGYEPLPEGFRIPSTGGGENPPGQIAPPDTGDGGLR
ncbi:MAG TPA: hypothetical protein VI876_13570 [Dehalococcoidia bacterium]|nr:hypothetical protein [Dehalococcoidia bacterium]